SAIRLLRPGGTAVLAGVHQGSITLDPLDLLVGEKRILTSLAHVYHTDFAAAVSLLNSRRVDVAPLITGRIPLRDVVKGFESLLAAPDDHIKLMVFPDGHS